VNRSAPWLAKDNERLKQLVATGAAAARAAAALSRTVMSVQVQARKLGTPFKSTYLLRRELRERACATEKAPR